MKISSFLILLAAILQLDLLQGAQGTVFNDKNQNGKKTKGNQASLILLFPMVRK